MNGKYLANVCSKRCETTKYLLRFQGIHFLKLTQNAKYSAVKKTDNRKNCHCKPVRTLK